MKAGLPSFDHLVSAGKKGLGNGNPQGFRSLEVDHKFEFRRLLDGKIASLGALCYAIHILSRTLKSGVDVGTVRYETTSLRVGTQSEDRHHALPLGCRRQAHPIREHRRGHEDNQCSAL